MRSLDADVDGAFEDLEDFEVEEFDEDGVAENAEVYLFAIFPDDVEVGDADVAVGPARFWSVPSAIINTWLFVYYGHYCGTWGSLG